MHRTTHKLAQGHNGLSFSLVWIVALAFLGRSHSDANADDKREPSVGAPGFIEQLVLPGTQLKGRSITEEAPVVVRVVQVFPHGDHFRYDLQFFGLEPVNTTLRNISFAKTVLASTTCRQFQLKSSRSCHRDRYNPMP